MKRTHPQHCLDILLWPFLKAVWEPYFRKNAHWWHWQKCNGSPRFPLFITPDEKSLSSRGGFFLNDSKSQNVVVFAPVDYEGPYRRGYVALENEGLKREICSVVLEGASAGMVGSHPMFFFALSYPDNRPIKLKLVSLVSKDKLPGGMILT
jgi:hypothetical protein